MSRLLVDAETRARRIAALRWPPRCSSVRHAVAPALLACPNGLHELDPAHANDTTTPSAAIVENVDVGRHADEGGCAIAGCGDRGTILFYVRASDDRAKPEELGVRLAVVGGAPPRGMSLIDYDVTLAYNGEVVIYFDYDAPPFEMDLEVRAIDRNGNLGPPTIVHIDNKPETSGGCAVGGNASWLLVLAAAASIVRRRRRS